MGKDLAQPFLPLEILFHTGRGQDRRKMKELPDLTCMPEACAPWKLVWVGTIATLKDFLGLPQT